MDAMESFTEAPTKESFLYEFCRVIDFDYLADTELTTLTSTSGPSKVTMRPGGVLHHASYSDLCESADHGCVLCSSILENQLFSKRTNFDPTRVSTQITYEISGSLDKISWNQVGNDKTAGTNPFLVETDGRQGEWLALSYCWGGTQPVRTTLETSQQHYDSIAMSELPQTLQDAIFITRRLGYQYLWVDALCIIQDSKDDWESEVRKIGEVYAGVLLTFAAEAASCCESGIFESSNIHRKKLKVYPFTVRAYSNKNHVEGQIHFRPQLNIARTEANPLARRAWAFQEGILSTRVIHFAEQQVWWHCTEIDIQEATPDWVLYTSTWQSQFDPPRIFLQLPYHTNSSLKYPLALGLKNWLSTVSAFTRRDLSLNNDRLAAISGLAKRTAQILKLPERSYLGGLWSNDLHRALLWSNLERAFFIRHCQGIAPSWSWASIDTSGLKELFPFSGVYDRFLCTRPVSGWDAEISLQAPDELEHQYSFGSTYFGMLRVRGMCLELCRCQIPSCVLDCHEVEESVWGAEKLVKEKLSNCKCITRETSRIKTPETILIQICARNSVDVRAHVLILEAVDASEYQYERIDMAEIPV